MEIAWIFLCKWNYFPPQKTKEMYFKSVQTCNRIGKYEITYGLKQFNSKNQDMVFNITDFHGDNEF